MTDQDVSGEEVELFARKLDDFARELSPIESALLATIVTRAAAGQEDVEGHFFDVGPIFADPSLPLAHAYAMVAWQDVLPHLQSLLQHVTAGPHLGPHPLPHLPAS